MTTYNEQSTVFVVKSMRLAGYLMYRGFVLKGCHEDRNNTGRNVFLFKNSKELISAIQDYKNQG